MNTGFLPGYPAREPGGSSARAPELALSGQALTELMQAVLERRAPFKFRARGGSMWPFVRDGDVICVSPLQRPPGIGDVVAFLHPGSGGLIVHRIVGRRAGAYLLRGDNARAGADGLVARDALLGRITGVWREDRPVRLGMGPERYAIALLSRYGWLPRLTEGLARLRGLVLRKPS